MTAVMPPEDASSAGSDPTGEGPPVGNDAGAGLEPGSGTDLSGARGIQVGSGNYQFNFLLGDSPAVARSTYLEQARRVDGGGQLPPSPEDITTPAEFARGLKQLMDWSGRSYRDIEEWSCEGREISRGTAENLTAGRATPRLNSLTGFLEGCGARSRPARILGRESTSRSTLPCPPFGDPPLVARVALRRTGLDAG